MESFTSTMVAPITTSINSVDCLEAYMGLTQNESLGPFHRHCVCIHPNVSLDQFLELNCFPSKRDIPFEVTTWIFYVILIVLASIGNVLVCYVVISMRRMHSVTNYYIANMAAGDLLMTCLCAPVTFFTVILLRRWPFGELLCRVVSFSQAVSVFVSAFSLVAISMDRHSAILHPLRPRRSLTSCRLIIALIWVLAALCCAPIAVTSTTWTPNEPRYRVHKWQICQEVWEGDGRQQYNIAVLTLQYFLPVVVLSVTYGRIVAEIWSQTDRLDSNASARDIRFSRAKKKSVVMMIIVVAVYTVCWLPHHSLQILLEINDSLYEWPGIVYVFTVFHWLSMSSCLWNPIIYCLMNAKFRSGFQQASSYVCRLCSARRWHVDVNPLTRTFVSLSKRRQRTQQSEVFHTVNHDPANLQLSDLTGRRDLGGGLYDGSPETEQIPQSTPMARRAQLLALVDDSYMIHDSQQNDGECVRMYSNTQL